MSVMESTFSELCVCHQVPSNAFAGEFLFSKIQEVAMKMSCFKTEKISSFAILENEKCFKTKKISSFAILENDKNDDFC